MFIYIYIYIYIGNAEQTSLEPTSSIYGISAPSLAFLGRCNQVYVLLPLLKQNQNNLICHVLHFWKNAHHNLLYLTLR